MSTTTSPFGVRGVIEGFYGRPWTHAQRLDLVGFMAAHGLNTFAYAPKDDPLLRVDWRQPYAGTDLQRFSELVRSCHDQAIELVYCLSPGLSISYASADDLAALQAKFDSVAELGVRSFGLVLDDIPTSLQHAADRQTFPDLVEAQISLIGRLFAGFGPERSLIVCPTEYHGYGDEEYISRLGRGIDPRIDLFWTGRRICSPTLDLVDAATFARATGRPATYWDNYPVNDVAMTSELHIGPYRGRDRHLWRFARGVIANGMELYEASKIAFATIADYLQAPEHYEPEESWRRALREVVGEDDLEAFALFADNVRSSVLTDEDAPIVGAALTRFQFERQHGAGSAAANRELATLAEQMQSAAERLLRGQMHNTALREEARPWIETFELGARALSCIARLATEGRLERDGRSELLPYLQRLRDARVRVFGDLLEMTLAELTAVEASDQQAERRRHK